MKSIVGRVSPLKIILNNESEKKIFKKLMDFVKELCLDDEISDENKEAFGLDSTELDFIENGLRYAVLEVDSSVREFEGEDTNVTGTCSVCGGETQGSIDSGEITYERYEDLMSKESQENWHCESCWGKERDRG